MRLLIPEKVPTCHGGNSTPGVGWPWVHLVGVLLCVCLHGSSRAAIAVAFAEHGVDSTPKDLPVALLGILLLRGLGVHRIGRDIVPLLLELSDRSMKLWNRGRDVGQLDDVCLWGFGKLPKLGQIIRLLLSIWKLIGESGENSASKADVPCLDIDAHGGGKALEDGEEAVSGQHWRFICVRVDDALRSHSIGAEVLPGLAWGRNRESR
mmetsp:Transcript_33111/g.93724  ORF Transcript_33111/g.93724 Transcript_33111/m.93724 type:complete len:208 (-) Transcript_33111:512-1135(-)